MRRVAFIVPGSLDGATGGSRYDRMVVSGLRRRGWAVDVREVEGAFPRPSPADLNAVAVVFRSLAASTVVVVDGLVLSAIPEVIEEHRARLETIALIHLPVAADVSLEPARAAMLESGERRALAASGRVVVTGRTTVRMLERYALERTPSVIEPGTTPRPLAKGSGGANVELLCVATLQPGKGHAMLFEAVKRLPCRNWRLTCAGSETRTPAAARELRRMVERLGLESHVAFTGELDERQLAARYDGADVFVLASLQETWGMAVAEALAHGLPVVSTTVGAVPDLVGKDAGLLVPPGDVDALAGALNRVVGGADFRSRLAEGARRVRDRLRRPEDTVAEWVRLLEGMHADV
jgi:glycosyltransferase involved in cell wall biosynthesis